MLVDIVDEVLVVRGDANSHPINIDVRLVLLSCHIDNAPLSPVELDSILVRFWSWYVTLRIWSASPIRAL